MALVILASSEWWLSINFIVFSFFDVIFYWSPQVESVVYTFQLAGATEYIS